MATRLSPVSTRPATTTRADTGALDELVPEVVATVRQWLDAAASVPVDASAGRSWPACCKDPSGSRVHRRVRRRGRSGPEEPRVAARTLAELAAPRPGVPARHLARGRCGSVRGAGLIAPRLVIPIVRRVLRGMVGHLIVDAPPGGRCAQAIRAHPHSTGARAQHQPARRGGARRARGARAGWQGTHEAARRDDVDYVSIKVSSTVAPHSAWAFDEAVDHIVKSLTPLFRTRGRRAGRTSSSTSTWRSTATST